jgi:pimeloyl-ACP methyl ester carboxylesterase
MKHEHFKQLRVLALTVACISANAQVKGEPPARMTANLGNGIKLAYVERGKGMPVVFVHWSLSDYTYWQDQLVPFAEKYRAIAYSRRYNFPNSNPMLPGYSAIVDADDLASLIKRLGLGRVTVIGHSYGALTALFLAVRHPELVRSLVLAEAPAVSLLTHLPGDDAKVGNAMFADIQERMVAPMRAAFQKGDRDAGIRAFMAYVFNDPQAWDKMSGSARQETLRDAREWDAIMTTGTLFPDIEPEAIRGVKAPVLILSGQKSYSFLRLIDDELARLLPNNQRIILQGAGHQMWLQQPERCRTAVEEFLRRSEGAMPIRGSGVQGHHTATCSIP